MNVIFLIEMLALVGALIWLGAEAIVTAVDWRRDRLRRAPRFEAPRRMALVAEDETDDEPPNECPGCGRNAGHDDDCYLQRVQRRAKEIQIPREGEPS